MLSRGVLRVNGNEVVRKLREYAESGRRVVDEAETYLQYHGRVPRFGPGDVVDYAGVPVEVEEVLDAWGPNQYTPYAGKSPHGYDYVTKVLRSRKGFQRGSKLQLDGRDLEGQGVLISRGESI